MGLLDDILGQGGLANLGSLVAKNPQLIAAAASLLSSRPGTVGGTGGLGGLIGQFQRAGLADMMSSWISTGPNPPISADQLAGVLGHDTIGQFAKQAGLPLGDAGSVLASLLPSLIDKLTPTGQVPHADSLEDSLGSLMGGLLGR